MATEPPEPVSDDEAIVNAEYTVTDEPEIVLYRKPESAIEDLTWNPEAAVAAVKGMPLAITDDRGKRTPCLYYSIPYRQSGGDGDDRTIHVRGPSAPLMRALVAQRGNFETISVDVAQGVQIVPEVINGERAVHQFPAIRATVRVRDLANNNVTTGVVTEPLFGQRSKGGLYAIPQAEANAISKATRNARAEHFAPIIPLLMQVLVREFEANGDVVKGELPEAVVTKALEAKRERAARENRDLLKIGVVAGQAFFDDEIAPLQDRLPDAKWKALGQDWREAEVVLCGGKLKDAPLITLDRCRAWLEQKKRELGLSETTKPAEITPEQEPPAYTAEGKPLEDYTPTAKELSALLASLDPDRRNDILAKVGADPEKPMTAEQRKTAWAGGHEAIEGDGHIQGALKLEAE